MYTRYRAANVQDNDVILWGGVPYVVVGVDHEDNGTVVLDLDVEDKPENKHEPRTLRLQPNVLVDVQAA